MIPRWAIKPLRERLYERLAERLGRKVEATGRVFAALGEASSMCLLRWMSYAIRIFTGTLALLIALAAWFAIVSLPNLWMVRIGGFLAGWTLFRWSSMLVERLPSLPCLLTDHVYADPPGASEPRCGRCDCSDYWPIRRTAGGYLERFASWIRRGYPGELPF